MYAQNMNSAKYLEVICLYCTLMQAAEERSLTYLTPQALQFFLALEMQCRKHFSCVAHIHKDSYCEMLDAITGSEEIHSLLCIAMTPDGDDGSELAVSADLKDIVYMRLITKWAHMRQREMRALYMMKHLKASFTYRIEIFRHAY